MTIPAPNIPNPDPSTIANERLAEALALVNSKMDRNQKENKGWIEALQLLYERETAEKFNSVRIQFEGVRQQFSNLADRVASEKRDAKQAIDAAFQAADKAAGKIEDSITKQIDSLASRVELLKEMANMSGGKSAGIGQTVTTVIAALALAASVASIVISKL